jgi:hypothetical protein
MRLVPILLAVASHPCRRFAEAVCVRTGADLPAAANVVVNARRAAGTP